MENVRLSIVVPVYCEESVISEFYTRLKKVLDDLGNNAAYDIIFVDDGSTDRSPELLRSLSKQDKSVTIISFSRNFGHQIAITAGIDHAKGDAVVVIDADLQDPPELIPEMLKKWRDGYKVVYAVRNKRKGDPLLKKVFAKAFYRILNMISDIEIPIDTGDYRLMDRVVVEMLKEMREENRYVRGLSAWVGFPQTGIYFDRDPRYAGEVKYTLAKSMKVALSGITSFSEKPLNFSSYAGFIITAFSFVYAVYLLISKTIRPDLVIQGWTTTIIVILFFGGVQLISIGIIGQYIAKIYREVKRRPLYVIKEKIGE